MNPRVIRLSWKVVMMAAAPALLAGAQDIQPYQAQEVKPYHAEPVRPAGVPQSSGRIAVDRLQCPKMRCEAVADRQADAPVIVASGTDAGAAAAGAVHLVLLGENGQLLHQERIIVGSDGGFRATISTNSLKPGAYKFGFVAANQAKTVIAAGSFAVTHDVAGNTAPGAGRKRGFAGFLERLNENAASTSAPAPTAQNANTAVSSGGPFFHTFGLAIPGVVYSTDNYATNTRTTTIAAGTVTKSAVRVNADGTYVWNSAWDGKIIRGNWKRDGSGLVLLAGQSGHDWRLDRLTPPQGKAVVVLYDSSTWYHGTPLD